MNLLQHFTSLISIINSFFLFITNRKRCFLQGKFSLVRFSSGAGFCGSFKNALFQSSIIRISGNSNTICAERAVVHKSNIVITGNNNTLMLGAGVRLRNAQVIIRGNSCRVVIGAGTTFGGVRIVNTGEHNSIEIGAGCLFSDHIEIWSSDTHPIYDESNKLINKDKPVFIGDKVWIGSRVIILKGVSIASGSIIGMGSLVTNDIPESSISIGVPNRVIRDGVHWSLHY